MPSLTAATTRLGLTGTMRPQVGAFSKTPPGPGARPQGPFTRLGLTGTMARPAGSFAGKSALAFLEKSSSLTIKPVVTIGDFSNIDVETSMVVKPQASMSEVINRDFSVAMTIRPVMTQARGSVLSSSVNKTPSHSIKPVVTLGSSVSVQVGSALSLVPVVALSNSDSLVSTTVSKAASHSLVPVVNLGIGVNRVNASQAWDIPLTVAPAVSLSSAVAVRGEVDRIEISVRPKGRIHIRRV